MKFSALVKGITDVRPVEFSLPGMAEPITVGQRPLLAHEELDVIERARAFCKKKNVEAPNDNDPIYVMAVWANTLLLSCQCIEGEDRGQPFFGSVDEILQGLDRDRISYLYEMQQRIQEDHGLRKERLSADEMLAEVHRIATSEVGDPSLPFWKWGPSLRASFMHFMAQALYFSRPDKLPSGMTSESDEKNASPKVAE